jgi:FkbM family methyltransferase
MPFSITYKDGQEFTSYNPFKFYDLRRFSNITKEINYNNKKIIFHNAERGEVEEVFSGLSYKKLPVNDKNVIDIGANIGDLSIYFALNGAKHVYAFEIVPTTSEICRENIKINHLEDLITCFNDGIGKHGIIKFQNNFYSDGEFSIKNSQSGEIPVEIQTLNEILNELNIDSAVMKIDCEGCEYNVITEENIESLKKLSYIIREYHYGYNKLKAVLEKSGFVFKASKQKHITPLKVKIHICRQA